MSDPDLIVIRPHPDLVSGLGVDRLPPHLDGRWMDVSALSAEPDFPNHVHTTVCCTATPTGRFEVRESDGAVAEVWEIRLRQVDEPS